MMKIFKYLVEISYLSKKKIHATPLRRGVANTWPPRITGTTRRRKPKREAKKEANLEPKRPREHSFSTNEELDSNESATIAIEAHFQGEHMYGTRPQVANLALSAIKHKGTAPLERVQKYPTDTFLSLSSLSPSGSHATIDTQPSVPASQRFSSANYEVRAFKDNNMMREEFKEAQEIARKYPTSTSSLPSSLSPLGPYVISDIHHRQPPDPALLSLNNCNLVDQ